MYSRRQDVSTGPQGSRLVSRSAELAELAGYRASDAADQRRPVPDAPEPVQFWLSDLPADTSLATLVHTSKLRWRVAND